MSWRTTSPAYLFKRLPAKLSAGEMPVSGRHEAGRLDVSYARACPGVKKQNADGGTGVHAAREPRCRGGGPGNLTA